MNSYLRSPLTSNGRYCSRAIFSVVLIGLLSSLDVFARVGGGQSYGGGSSGHGGGGGGGAIIYLIFQAIRLLVYLTIEYPIIGVPLDILVVAGIIFYFTRRRRATRFMGDAESVTLRVAADPERQDQTASKRGFDQLRRFDPNFSEIVFTDFCYALYAKAHDARARGAAGLDLFSPYLSAAVRNSLQQRNPQGLREVKGIIVGSMAVTAIEGLETPVVRVRLMFEANYTEVAEVNNAQTEMSYYVRELWELERKRDLLSPPPAQATALHCPRCGGPLQRDSVGACAFCGTKIDNGEFQWFVRNAALLSREARGPLLTSDVPEVGTDLPSVVLPNLEVVRAEFERDNPTFSWGAFEARAKLIFDELQAAWSTLNWERARPHETDNIFQMHQYWISAYKREGLRNILDQCAITAIQPVKISSDAFYNSITLRIWAQGYDYTVDKAGKVVSGSKDRLRQWSEYWTFIRSKTAAAAPARTELNCPNCGGPLKINASGICEFCGGKITSGDFDWVLSRIEQDESYAG